MNKDIVVIGFLGNILDRGFNAKRWDRWRPTPALVGHEDTFPVSRVELIYTDEEHEDVLNKVIADIKEKSPVTKVVSHYMPVKHPWDFNDMYGALFDFGRAYPFDTEGEEYFLHMSTGTHVAKICLFLLAESRTLPAQLVATRPCDNAEAGPDDVWRGGISTVDLRLSRYDAIASRFETIVRENSDLLRSGIKTRNAVFNELIGEIEQVCLRSSAPMLITGPTGAGKSQLVSRVFELRQANNLVSGAFVEVNCATLRGDNAMSALFGHKKGAYTGAVADRKGLLLEADKGCIFLDEIGELGLEEQALLLRAIEDKRFSPMGSEKLVSSDFQLIAGTNRDLPEEVAKGRFRADLLARLNVWTFCLPGLAERVEDIEPNIDHETNRLSKELKMLVSFNSSARKAYLAFAHSAPWPGNFRDLRASVERMATLAPGGRIDEAGVEKEIRRLQKSWGVAVTSTETKHARLPGYWAELALGAEANKLSRIDLLTVDALIEQVRLNTSAAGVARKLLDVPGAEGEIANYSSRGKKMLAQYGLEFQAVKELLVRKLG